MVFEGEGGRGGKKGVWSLVRKLLKSLWEEKRERVLGWEVGVE